MRHWGRGSRRRGRRAEAEKAPARDRSGLGALPDARMGTGSVVAGNVGTSRRLGIRQNSAFMVCFKGFPG